MKLKKWLLLICVVAAGIFTGCEMKPEAGFDDLEFSPDFKIRWAYSTSKYYEAEDYLWVTVQSNYEDLGMSYSDYSKLDVKYLMTLSFEGNPEYKIEMKSYDDCKSYNGRSLVLPEDVYSGKINYTIKLLSGEKSKEISGTYDWKTD